MKSAAAACIRRFASASASMARNESIASKGASGSWADHRATNPNQHGAAANQEWSRSGRPTMKLKMNHESVTESDAKLPSLTAVMSKPLEEDARGDAKPVVSLTAFELRQQRLASLAAEFAAAQFTKYQSESQRDKARRKCQANLIELIDEALVEHKHRVYARNNNRRKEGACPRLRSDYDVEVDGREICNLARFYDARFTVSALPLALRLYTTALAGAKIASAEFDRAVKLFLCTRSTELLIAAASIVDDPESAVDVMKRTTKYNFKLTWSEAIKPFLNCVVRNNAPAQASYLFNSIKLSPLLLEMETSVLNRLLPLTQSNHCKWMLPPLLRRLEKEEKWTRFQYHTVVQSLLMSRDADSLISVYERWCEQSLVEPKLREEATVKLFLHALLTLQLLRPYRELVNLYPMSSVKNHRRRMLQHLILEAEEGDLDNFRKVYDRLDTFHKTSDVASDTDKADIYQNVVARKLACHVLAYARVGRIDDPEVQQNIASCRAFGAQMSWNIVPLMQALYISNRIDEAIEFGRVCAGTRVARTYLSWLLLYSGADPSSLLQQALDEIKEEHRAILKKPRANYELVRPQQFGAVLVSHVLNGNIDGVSQLLTLMQQLKLCSSACCDLAAIAGRAVRGDVESVRRLYAEYDAKIEGLWNYQFPHPEVVWTNMDIVDGRQYLDVQLIAPVFDVKHIVALLVPGHTERALRILTTLEPSDAVTRQIKHLKGISDRMSAPTTELIAFYMERSRRKRTRRHRHRRG